jgi:hypothetical protein
VIDGQALPRWLTSLAWISVALAIGSSLVILGDILAGRRQKMAVMNAVWPITALYFGPLAIWVYWRFGRSEPKGNPKEKPFWAITFVGDSHCAAGCTIGDFAGEWLVFLSGFAVAGSVLWADYTVDFVFAYLVGVVFQYFAIAPMRNLSGWPGIVAAIKADTISLASFEIGMFAWMAFSSQLLFQPKLEPNQMAYWFSMQVAMVVGFCTAFPANWWLIRKGVKESM